MGVAKKKDEKSTRSKQCDVNELSWTDLLNLAYSRGISTTDVSVLPDASVSGVACACGERIEKRDGWFFCASAFYGEDA